MNIFRAPHLTSGAHAIQGRRASMEDAHVMFDDFNKELGVTSDTPRSFYAIYDGHGGDTAAKYCGELYHKTFGSLLNLEKPATTIEDQDAIVAAIKESYKKCDQKIVELTEKDDDKSGATSVTILIEDDEYRTKNHFNFQAFLSSF